MGNIRAMAVAFIAQSVFQYTAKLVFISLVFRTAGKPKARCSPMTGIPTSTADDSFLQAHHATLEPDGHGWRLTYPIQSSSFHWRRFESVEMAVSSFWESSRFPPGRGDRTSRPQAARAPPRARPGNRRRRRRLVLAWRALPIRRGAIFGLARSYSQKLRAPLRGSLRKHARKRMPPKR